MRNREKYLVQLVFVKEDHIKLHFIEINKLLFTCCIAVSVNMFMVPGKEMWDGRSESP